LSDAHKDLKSQDTALSPRARIAMATPTAQRNSVEAAAALSEKRWTNLKTPKIRLMPKRCG